MFRILFFLGLLIRFLLIGVPGFKADIAFWKGWGLAVADKGIIWLVNNTNYNYPPGFAYILWLINKIYALLADPYKIGEYWLDNNYLYLFLFKIITIAADIGVVFLLIKIADHFKFKWGRILALFYFLNPAVIYDGVIWGQVDQLGLFLFLLSIYYLIKEKTTLATIVFTVSFLMKFQNIIFIPIFYLYLLKKYSFQELIKSLRVTFLVLVVVTFPFWFYRQAASLIRLLTVNSDWFPWYSLNAFNFWWLASGLNGLKLSDKNLVFGILNAKQSGLLFFSFFYFVACLKIYLAKKEDQRTEFILASSLIVFSFYHLLTQSHERYLFPLLGLLPLLMIVRGEKNHFRFTVFYFLLSLMMFSNMYLSMAMNYSDQVVWPFSIDITRSVSLYLAVVQIGLFGYFLWSEVGDWLMRKWRILVVCLGFLMTVVVFKNYRYWTGGKISLTEIRPIEEKQDYLLPVYNKTVESGRTVFSWNRLSNDYFFYDQGIGSHANSVISYGLGGRFDKFNTDYGVDTEATDQNKAIFIIQGDGRELYRSKPRGRFDLPESVTVSIDKINKLTLMIETEGASNYGLHADWLRPSLTR